MSIANQETRNPPAMRSAGEEPSKGLSGMTEALDAYEELTKRLGRSLMHPWVDAIVSRHWLQCQRISGMRKFVMFYLRPRYGSAGANATWYKNRHSKKFKTFQNAATDTRHFADPLAPTNGGTDINMSRFKGAGPDEYAEITISEEEMRLIRKAQKHLNSMRGSAQALRTLLDKSDLLKELDDLGQLNFTPFLGALPADELFKDSGREDE